MSVGATLPHEARALVRASSIRTMAHVDALLALRGAAPRCCTLAEIAEAARLPLGTVAERCVDDLVESGLVARLADRSAYHYAPRSRALLVGVDALAAMRQRRPAALARVLYLYTAEPRRGTREETRSRAHE